MINSNVRIGENYLIHVFVKIGASGGEFEAPQSRKQYLHSSRCKLFGDIKIADNTVISVNAVVHKSFDEKVFSLLEIR